MIRPAIKVKGAADGQECLIASTLEFDIMLSGYHCLHPLRVNRSWTLMQDFKAKTDFVPSCQP